MWACNTHAGYESYDADVKGRGGQETLKGGAGGTGQGDHTGRDEHEGRRQERGHHHARRHLRRRI